MRVSSWWTTTGGCSIFHSQSYLALEELVCGVLNLKLLFTLSSYILEWTCFQRVQGVNLKVKTEKVKHNYAIGWNCFCHLVGMQWPLCRQVRQNYGLWARVLFQGWRPGARNPTTKRTNSAIQLILSVKRFLRTRVCAKSQTAFLCSHEKCKWSSTTRHCVRIPDISSGLNFFLSGRILNISWIFTGSPTEKPL